MKRMFLMVLAMVVLYAGMSHAGEGTYSEKVKHKMTRGWKNIVVSEMTIPKYVNEEVEKHGEKAGKVLGTVRGVNTMIVRKLVGVLDLLTVPFPFDIYVFDPEIPGEKSAC